MLKFVTILSILAMFFCTVIVFAALLAGSYLKIREVMKPEPPKE